MIKSRTILRPSIWLPLIALVSACASSSKSAADQTKYYEDSPIVSPAGDDAPSEPDESSFAGSGPNAESSADSPAGTELVSTEAPAKVAKQDERRADDKDRALELSIWRSPLFRRQFADSLKAETEIEPRLTRDESEVMLEVLELFSGDKMAEAASLLRENLNDASSAVFDFTLANIYLQNDQVDEAITAYRIAVKKHPKFRRAWRYLGVGLVREGKHKGAAEALTRVLELGGADAVTYGLLGYSYANLKNEMSAETAYRQAILLDPLTLDWKMGLAESLFKQERFPEVIALCDKLIADQPESARLWLVQANAYLGLKRPRDAAENLELVDRLGHSTVDSLNLLADIYVNLDLYDLAVDTYIRALEKKPEAGARRAIDAAKVLTTRGGTDETRRLVNHIDEHFGADLEPKDRIEVHRLRARMALIAGAGDEEAKELEKIVVLDPLDGEALILLGQHSGRGGDTEKAVFYYERAAAIEKFEADAKLRHGELLVREGKYAEALPFLRRSVALKRRSDVEEFLAKVERVAKNRR